MVLILTAIALSFFVTMVLEFVPALFLKNKSGWMKTSVLCNIITNPILNLVLFFCIGAQLPGVAIFIAAIIGEIAVVVFEGNIYKKVLGISAKTSFTYSVSANLLSLIIGSIIWALVFNFVMEAVGMYPVHPSLPGELV